MITGFYWLLESQKISHLGLAYLTQSGIVTGDACRAKKFSTRADAERWREMMGHSDSLWIAREHGFSE